MTAGVWRNISCAWDAFLYHWVIRDLFPQSNSIDIAQKIIHQVTIMLATSKNVPFAVYNHLLLIIQEFEYRLSTLNG